MTKGTRLSETWILPDWINKEAWEEFEKHRKEIRKPLTERARQLQWKKLEGLSQEEQRQTIERSIESRWVGLFPKQEQPQKKPLAQKKYEAKPIGKEQWKRNREMAQRHIGSLKKALRNPNI